MPVDPFTEDVASESFRLQVVVWFSIPAVTYLSFPNMVIET